ncbi:Epidermal growth factor-like domain-containing protein [Aphelenchoides bicaudatus]|nr:Epidermal growth factor-like domain-containing protein [Aphelenchoides bicaudatus]
MTDYLPSTVFENALILDESGLDCSQQNEFTFPVESRANSLSVIARGLGISGKISMVDENGTPLPMNVKSSDQASFIATFTTTAGTKKVTYKTTSKECGVQVRAVSGLHTELGFTRDIHDDHPNERPTIVSAKNGSTYVTVKIGKAFMAKADVVPTHIKFLYRDLRTGRNTVLAESDLIARDLNRCANQYISALLEIPPGQYKNNHTPLFAQLTGKEGDTDSFQRLQLYFPETINCQHGVDHDQFGYCNCPVTWSGDDCSVPNCKNDGVVDLTVCSCKSGFYGAICDIPVV